MGGPAGFLVEVEFGTSIEMWRASATTSG